MAVTYSPTLMGNTPLDQIYLNWYTHPELFNGDCGAFHEHMPVLRLLCSGKRVVELGSRHGVSTLAILASRPLSLVSYDLDIKSELLDLQIFAVQENIPFSFVEANDLEIEIPDCDILFIDTLHDYAQLRQELALHGNKSAEYIIGHDLASFGVNNESATDQAQSGLIPALEEFLANNPHWKSVSFWFNCNGLWILRRNS